VTKLRTAIENQRIKFVFIALLIPLSLLESPVL